MTKEKLASAAVGVGVALLVFDLNYYFMAHMPGERNLACVIGAGLTPVNVAFSAVLSLIVGVMVAMLMELWWRRRALGVGSGGAVGLGAIVGVLTVFCTFCTLPVISVLGISVGLSFFTFYEIPLKILSLVLMSWGLWRLRKQLKGDCRSCRKR